MLAVLALAGVAVAAHTLRGILAGGALARFTGTFAPTCSGLSFLLVFAGGALAVAAVAGVWRRWRLWWLLGDLGVLFVARAAHLTSLNINTSET